MFRAAYHLIMSEHTHRKAVLDDVVRFGRSLRQQFPTSYNSYAAPSTPAKAPGSLDATTERTDRRLGVSITLCFDGWIASHARRCEAGASREEAAEAFGVALTLQCMEARDHDR